MSENNSIASNRSTFKEFLASIATIQGDLSNITAPPFVLGEHSTVELPQYWANHPSLFIAPALAKSPEGRALRVLKWFLGSLKNQQYAGRKPEEGVKKPLNAFLGELFLGSWDDEGIGETRLVSEQVGHHPPVTACYLWNETHGIRAEGFTCQEITFSGSVSIKQKGYAIVHIDEYDEDYLIPVPNVKVKGVLSGTPYPELHGKYSIVSSSGFNSEIKFEGKGLIVGGTKNGVEARVFNVSNPSKDFYTVDGSWSDTFVVRDGKNGNVVETYSVDAENSQPLHVPDVSKQDPWETRRAWKSVREALMQGDMKTTSDEKSIIEEGQRRMRKDEESRGEQWQRIFFRRQDDDPVFKKLSGMTKESFDVDQDGGTWKVNKDAIVNTTKPYHGDLVPAGEHSKPSVNNTAAKQPDVLPNGAPKSDTTPPGDGEVKATPSEDKVQGRDQLEKIQVEEMLRATYSSSTR